MWDESKHPRDKIGRFTEKNGDLTYQELIRLYSSDSELRYKSDTFCTKFEQLFLDSNTIKVKSSPITNSVIDSVPLVKIPGFSDKENEYIQSQHKELLKYAKAMNNEREVAFVFREGFLDKNIICGTENSIDMTYALNGKGNNLVVMHNHPSNQSFSLNDMMFFIGNDEVHILTIVKHNSNVEILVKNTTYDKTKALIAFERNYKKLVKTNSRSEIDKAILRTILNNGGLFECLKSQC